MNSAYRVLMGGWRIRRRVAAGSPNWWAVLGLSLALVALWAAVAGSSHHQRSRLVHTSATSDASRAVKTERHGKSTSTTTTIATTSTSTTLATSTGPGTGGAAHRIVRIRGSRHNEHRIGHDGRFSLDDQYDGRTFGAGTEHLARRRSV